MRDEPNSNPDRLKGINTLAASPWLRGRHRKLLLEFVSNAPAGDAMRMQPVFIREAYVTAARALSADDPAQEWDAVGLLGAIYSVHWSEVETAPFLSSLKRAGPIAFDALEIALGNRRLKQWWEFWR